MNKTVERWYPFVGGLAAGAGFYCAQEHFQWPYPQTMPNLLSSVTNVSTIAIGILCSGQFILLAMDGNEFIQRLRDQQYFEPIMTFLMNALHWSFGLAVISAVGMLADPTHSRSWYMPACSIWVFVLVSSALAYYRVITIFSSIVRKGLNPAPTKLPIPPRLPIDDDRESGR